MLLSQEVGIRSEVNLANNILINVTIVYSELCVKPTINATIVKGIDNVLDDSINDISIDITIYLYLSIYNYQQYKS